MTLPTVPESFYWTPSPCGPVLKCRPLEAAATHLFTTRELPLSTADDWRRAGGLLGVAEVVTSSQVHGREVLTMRRGSPLAVNAKYVVHSGVPGKNGGYDTNHSFLEGPPNETPS